MSQSENARLALQVRECTDRIGESGVAALAGLFDLTADRLVRLAVTVTRNQHDAEDAVQSALVRVATNPRQLCKANEPWFYILRIVRNEALAILRKRKRSVILASISDLITQHFVDHVEEEESQQAVWVALRKLPTKQSEVVVLKIWEGLTFAQVAHVLGISPATAASRYRYAMEKLTNSLSTKSAVDRQCESVSTFTGGGAVTDEVAFGQQGESL